MQTYLVLKPPYDIWVKTNKKAGESTRESIDRYGDIFNVSGSGTAWLKGQYLDQIKKEDMCWIKYKDKFKCY